MSDPQTMKRKACDRIGLDDRPKRVSVETTVFGAKTVQVDLRSLQPNPVRDFAVDPIDPEAVERLKQSIEEDGFWGGVVCRQCSNGVLQIVAGHHRVAAALAAGLTKADLFVSRNITEDEMVRIYARENATQRGNCGTARAGTVASALRIIAKRTLMGCGESPTPSQAALNRQIIGEKGLGRRTIGEYLRGVPGVTDETVKQDLANLKTSGRYAGIMKEVEAEIDREAEEARAKAEQDAADEKAKEEAEAKAKARDRAAQAAKAAKENNPRVFDYEGVSKHFTNSEQIDAFREAVTGKGVAPILPVEKQAELAAAIKENLKQRGEEMSLGYRQLSAQNIHNAVISLVMDAKSFRYQTSKAAKEAAIERDIHLKSEALQDDAIRHLIGVDIAARGIHKFIKKHGRTFQMSHKFREAVITACRMFDDLRKRIAIVSSWERKVEERAGLYITCTRCGLRVGPDTLVLCVHEGDPSHSLDAVIDLCGSCRSWFFSELGARRPTIHEPAGLEVAAKAL